MDAGMSLYPALLHEVDALRILRRGGFRLNSGCDFGCREGQYLLTRVRTACNSQVCHLGTTHYY